MNTFPTVEELKIKIERELQLWHRGQENRAEKWILAEQVCGVSIPLHERNNNSPYERRMRLAIAELRKEGKPICSDTTGGGYWWATSMQDVLVMSGELRARAKDLLQTARQMRAEALREFGGQERLF